MTQQQFTKLMERFKKLYQEVERVSDVINESSASDVYHPLPFGFGYLSDIWLDTIKEAMNDEGNLISYWIYELDFGRKAKKGTVEDGNGKNLPIKTISDLYNIINK